MRRNRMLSTVFLAGVLAIAAAGAIFATSSDNQYYDANIESPSITLKSGTNQLFSGTTSLEPPYNSTIYTGYGNPIEVHYSVFVNRLYDGSWHAIGAGGYFENNDQILGLSSITFSLNNAEGVSSSVKIEWTRTKDSYASSDWETIVATGSSSYTCDFNGHSPNYFRFTNLEGSDITVKEAVIRYSCSEATGDPKMTTKDHTKLRAPYVDATNGTVYSKTVTEYGTHTFTETRTVEFDGSNVREVRSQVTEYKDGSPSKSYSEDHVYDGTYLYASTNGGSYSKEENTEGYPTDFYTRASSSLFVGRDVVSIFTKSGDTFTSSAPYYWGGANEYTLEESSETIRSYSEATVNVDENGAITDSHYVYDDYSNSTSNDLTVKISAVGSTSVTIPEEGDLPPVDPEPVDPDPVDPTPGTDEGTWNDDIATLSYETGAVTRVISEQTHNGEGYAQTKGRTDRLEVNGNIASQILVTSTETSSSSTISYYKTENGEPMVYSDADGVITDWAAASSIPSLSTLVGALGIVSSSSWLSSGDLSFDGSVTYTLSNTSLTVNMDENYALSSGSTHKVNSITILAPIAGITSIIIELSDASTSSNPNLVTINYTFSRGSSLSADSFPGAEIDVAALWSGLLDTTNAIRAGVGQLSVYISDSAYITATEELTKRVVTDAEYDFNGDLAYSRESVYDDMSGASSESELYHKKVGDTYYSYDDYGEATWASSTSFPSASDILLGEAYSLLSSSDPSDYEVSGDSTLIFSYIIPENGTGLIYDVDSNGKIISGSKYALSSLSVILVNGALDSIDIFLSVEEGDTTSYYIVSYSSFSTSSYLVEDDYPFDEFVA